MEPALQGKENRGELERGESLFANTLFGCQIGGAARADSASPVPSSTGRSSFESARSLDGLSRMPSLELPPAAHNKACAKQLNMRLMHSSSPQEIFDLAVANMANMDSINLTAAFQRIAKLNDSHPPSMRESVLASPVFRTLAEMLVEECNAGRFNSQSTSNAWWAFSKLVPGTHPLATSLFLALETALLGCFSSLTEGERPNSQAISSIFYAWGRLDGYLPSITVLQPMWERTLVLALTFDTQGVANTLWALGMLKKKHGDAFAIRTDVLSALSFLVCRIIPSFAVQGLSCAAIGCANMGPSLRCSVTPLMESIIAESLKRPHQFTMQAMANLVCAIARIGHQVAASAQTQLLLAAFDVHAAGLPPPYKAQELQTLYNSMLKCRYSPRCFRVPGMDQHRGGGGHGYQAGPAAPAPPRPYTAPPPAGPPAVLAFPQHPLGMLPNGIFYDQAAAHQAAAAAAAAACMGSLASPFAAALVGAGYAAYPPPMDGTYEYRYAEQFHPAGQLPLTVGSLAAAAAVPATQGGLAPQPTAAAVAAPSTALEGACDRQSTLEAVLLALQTIKLQQELARAK